MDIGEKYTFVYLPEKNNPILGNKKIQEYFRKWGLNFMTQSFAFNEPYIPYQKCIFAEAFFKDALVANVLNIWSCDCFKKLGIIATEVHVKQIPCTITKMEFFHKIKNPRNKIVYESGCIRPVYDNFIDGILVADNLRSMMLDEESYGYHLYTQSERNEFIFKIFQMLVIGGEYCQYENKLDIYLEITKAVYKNFVRIQLRENDNNLMISTIVLEVIAKNRDPYFPTKPEHKQNVGYLLIDPISREVTTFLHQY